VGKIKIIKTPIQNLIVIEPQIFGDERGFFFESYNEKEFFDVGISDHFVQDNHSKSSRGVLRGLHFQTKHSQAKLVRVIKGTVFDVAVDMRRDSDTFGQWYGLILSEENKKVFYVPENFAHGFLTISEEAEFLYKVSDFYHPEFDAGILWDDPDIKVKWPFQEYRIKKEDLILSEKDKNLPYLKDIL